MTRVKICGITRLDDALLAEAEGAWAVGFVFAPSPRSVDPATARAISLGLGPLILRVGVFVDTPPEEVLATVEAARLQAVQLHGHEPPSWAEAIRERVPVIKAFRLQGPALPEWREYPCDALLIDGARPGSGEGYPAEWLLPLKDYPRLIVAGGLRPDRLQLPFTPYALDVSSGVELRPGIKDPERVRRFLLQARQL